jgi:hypothetical protein
MCVARRSQDLQAMHAVRIQEIEGGLDGWQNFELGHGT